MTTLFHQLIHRLATDSDLRRAFQAEGEAALADTQGLSSEDRRVLHELQRVWRALPDTLVSIPDWDGRSAQASLIRPA
jgi:hypothetical protein